MLQPLVEQSLTDINFIDRYREISDEFSIKDESYNYEKSDVVNILNELGVVVNLYEGDQYFADFETIDDYQFRFGLTIKFNIVEFDLTVKNESLSIKSGGSWGLLVQLMTDWRENVKKPGFGNHEQLKSLLTMAVILYEDIKKELLSSQA
ncbi:hypothetical protein C7460_103305 [Marinoscillum furvescens DSM 4134]|uniref:Uncharacterized protein n=2 Tax=Marinoscillum furvescens TaxID=1026 RepID=A0A3D9L6K2_MARFU|nr:hypothetical protein C7460_103305 [Marinoscillum furvescens DSM 4134]